jgi:hypothetical protein
VYRRTAKHFAGWAAEWNVALDELYVVLVPGDDGRLIMPNGRIWQGDESGLIGI